MGLILAPETVLRMIISLKMTLGTLGTMAVTMVVMMVEMVVAMTDQATN